MRLSRFLTDCLYPHRGTDFVFNFEAGGGTQVLLSALSQQVAVLVSANQTGGAIGTCPAGSALTAIRADGTITCSPVATAAALSSLQSLVGAIQQSLRESACFASDCPAIQFGIDRVTGRAAPREFAITLLPTQSLFLVGTWIYLLPRRRRSWGRR